MRAIGVVDRLSVLVTNGRIVYDLLEHSIQDPCLHQAVEVEHHWPSEEHSCANESSLKLVKYVP